MKIRKNEFNLETQRWSQDFSSAGVLNSIPCMDLDERLRAVEKRLLLVAPPVETLSKYPALAEAYREYKTIEALILGQEDDYRF
jgi:hypothetical protein